MKYILKFDNFLNESQTKKLQKYFTFSVVLEWYRKNKELIAKTLGCDVSDLASEDTLMEQSYGLINRVINPQSSGNEGREEVEVSGFSDFDKLEKNLIHDILHNMYQVQSKEFSKSLSDLEYSESEIFEEIEVLGIEESFMKNMNIRYPKTDFINQNINLLASYLMVTILKYDPNRIEKILDGEIEPYLEIYGKKYPVKGTAYESFFNMFKTNKTDSNFEADDSDKFKDYMIHLINVGRGIDETGGDRAQYPGNEFFGTKSWYDLSEDEQKDKFEDTFDQDYVYRDTTRNHIDSDNDITLSKLKKDKFPYILLGKLGDEMEEPEVDNPNQLKLFHQYEKFLNEYKKELSNVSNLTHIPLKSEFIDIDTNEINLKIWFNYLENLYNIEFYKIDETKYLCYQFNRKTKKYSLLDNEEVEEILRDQFDSNSDEHFDSDHKFIDFDEYEKKSFSEISKIVLKNSESNAIMRRNFRTNDVIKNNTKLGNLKSDWRGNWKQDEIETKGGKNNYIDFTPSDDASDKSISKNLLTDNAKRLVFLLNNLKGYFIKNIDIIKNNFKEKTNKFNKSDIEKFRDINLSQLKNLLEIVTKIDTNIDNVNFEFRLMYGWSSSKFNGTLIFVTTDQIDSILEFTKMFSTFKELRNKIQNKKDVEYLMNYVNDKGLLRTPKDFTKFKNFISKISKYETIMNNFPHKDIIVKLKNDFNDRVNYHISDEELKIVQEVYESGDKENFKNILINIIHKNIPYLKFKNLDIIDIYTHDTNFSITI